MKTFIQNGDVLDLTAPYDVTSGNGFKVGDIIAVAVVSALNGKPVEGKTSGVFDLTYGVNAALAVGAKVYWDDAAKGVTGTAGGNTLCGYCVKAAVANDVTARVRLIPQA